MGLVTLVRMLWLYDPLSSEVSNVRIRLEEIRQRQKRRISFRQTDQRDGASCPNNFKRAQARINTVFPPEALTSHIMLSRSE